MRYLFRWQRVAADQRAEGGEGLAAVIEQLAGYEAAASAWEADILPMRVRSYDPTLLDSLCLSGRAMWGRLSVPAGGGSAPVRATPLAIVPRESVSMWVERTGVVESALSGDIASAKLPPGKELSANAAVVHDVLAEHGASFFHDLVAACGILPTQVEAALAELVACGLATADSFTGLRALLVPEHKRASLSGGVRRRRRASAYSVANAGRWSLLVPAATDDATALEQRARALLRRYGVVFRRLLARETNAPAWRDLIMVYRRLEARGEIRGGRFVSGMAGEQFALPEAVGLLRSVRRDGPTDETVVLSAADPLNLVGIITPETERVTATHRNRIMFRNGSAIAAAEGGQIRLLCGYRGEDEADLRTHLGRALITRRNARGRSPNGAPDGAPLGAPHAGMPHPVATVTAR
jgi:ATP-dependent Lhr-like helicase